MSTVESARTLTKFGPLFGWQSIISFCSEKKIVYTVKLYFAVGILFTNMPLFNEFSIMFVSQKIDVTLLENLKLTSVVKNKAAFFSIDPQLLFDATYRQNGFFTKINKSLIALVESELSDFLDSDDYGNIEIQPDFTNFDQRDGFFTITVLVSYDDEFWKDFVKKLPNRLS